MSIEKPKIPLETFENLTLNVQEKINKLDGFLRSNRELVGTFHEIRAHWNEVAEKTFGVNLLAQIPEYHAIMHSTMTERTDDDIDVVSTEERYEVLMVIGAFLAGLEERWGFED